MTRSLMPITKEALLGQPLDWLRWRLRRGDNDARYRAYLGDFSKRMTHIAGLRHSISGSVPIPPRAVLAPLHYSMPAEIAGIVAHFGVRVGFLLKEGFRTSTLLRLYSPSWASWLGPNVFMGGNTSAVLSASKLLRSDRIDYFVVFPHGTRAQTALDGSGDLRENDPFVRELDMGAVTIAKRAGLPVVPLYLRGAGIALPRGSLRVTIGTAIECRVGAAIRTSGRSTTALNVELEAALRNLYQSP